MCEFLFISLFLCRGLQVSMISPMITHTTDRLVCCMLVLQVFGHCKFSSNEFIDVQKLYTLHVNMIDQEIAFGNFSPVAINI